MSRLLSVILAATFFAAPSSQPTQTGAPLETRVTIDYRDARASDILDALATAAGLPLELNQGDLNLVTITLTNVKLSTALNAMCENASCVWSLVTTNDEPWKLRVTPVPAISSMPPSVSFDVQDTPARDVFRALAAAIGVQATVDPGIPTTPVTIRFKSAATAEVLTQLCKLHGCDWSFDAARGLRVMRRP